MILDLFSGCGGWSQGLRLLNRECDLGIDLSKDACDSANANSKRKVYVKGNVETFDFKSLPDVTGIMASPPCVSFSIAGKQSGLDSTPGRLTPKTRSLIIKLRPQWFVCEQVPQVLPIWREYAKSLDRYKYRSWCGILDASHFEVPQSRRRAVWIGVLKNRPQAPTPSGLQPITMAEALDLDPNLEWRLDKRTSNGMIFNPYLAPSPTVTGAALSCVWVLYNNKGERRSLTLEEGLKLQSFPSDYKLMGTNKLKGKQIGNAIPPLLAREILKTVIN